MRGKFISLEGLSGVGKSTISKLLAEKIKAELVGTIPRIFGDLRRALDHSETTSIHTRFLFYLAAVLEGERSIREVLSTGKTVVVESYLYRTIAFHRGMGSNFDISIPGDILLPDVVFHLICEEVERQWRRKTREKYETHWGRLAEQNAERILREYQQFKMSVVDTTCLKPEEVVNELINRLNMDGEGL